MPALATASEYMAAALLLRKQDQPQAALRYADRACSVAPHDPVAAKLQGELRNELHWLEGSCAAFRRALTLEPNDRALRADLAEQYLRFGELDIARELAEGEPEPDTEHSDRLRWVLIEVHLQQRRVAAASELLDAASGLTMRRAVGYLRAGVLARAAECAATLGNDVNALVLRSRVALWSGHDREAQELADVALGVAAKSADVHALLAEIALVRDDDDDALAHVADALGCDAECVEALIVRAELTRRRHSRPQKNGAVFDLGKAYRSADTYNVALELNSVVARALSKHVKWDLLVAEFRCVFNRARDLVGDIPPGEVTPTMMQSVIDRALRRMSGNRGAIATYRANTTSEPKRLFVEPDPRTAAMNVRGLLRTRGFSGVLECYAAQLEQYAGHPLIYTHRAELLLWMGDYVAAARDFETALAASHQIVWAYIGLAMTHTLRGAPARAIEVLAEAEKNVWQGPTTWVVRGEAHRLLGHRERARADLMRATQDAPRRVSAWINLALLEDEEGHREAAEEAAHTVGLIVPDLFRDLAWDCRKQRRGGNAHADAGGVHPTLSELRVALEMMRGNRSSKTVTYFTADGQAHLINV